MIRAILALIVLLNIHIFFGFASARAEVVKTSMIGKAKTSFSTGKWQAEPVSIRDKSINPKSAFAGFQRCKLCWRKSYAFFIVSGNINSAYSFTGHNASSKLFPIVAGTILRIRWQPIAFLRAKSISHQRFFDVRSIAPGIFNSRHNFNHSKGMRLPVSHEVRSCNLQFGPVQRRPECQHSNWNTNQSCAPNPRLNARPIVQMPKLKPLPDILSKVVWRLPTVSFWVGFFVLFVLFLFPPGSHHTTLLNRASIVTAALGFAMFSIGLWAS